MALPSPLLTKRSKLAFKLEAAEGTAESLTLAELMMVFDPKFTPNIEMKERSPAQGHLSEPADAAGARSGQITFEVEIQGSGTAGTAPFYGDILKACGCDETIVASTSVTYTPGPADPVASPIPSATLGLELDGKVYLLWGARGDVSPVYDKVGEPARLRFTFTGGDFSETDTALTTGTPTWPSVTPPAFMGATLTLDASAVAKVNSLTLNAGNNVVLRKDATATAGSLSAVITGRKPTLTMDPENIAIATHDFLGKWRSGTTVALINTIGATAGNICTLNVPKLQYRGIAPADRDGLSTLDINCKCCQETNDGNDEWSLALT